MRILVVGAPALKMDPSQGPPAAVVARSYVQSVTGADTGSTLEPSAWSRAAIRRTGNQRRGHQ
jgi:hypothetical protein